jgi:hypothetical protein
MSIPVRATRTTEPPAEPDEIAAILAVLGTVEPAAAATEREPAWRVAARREAIGATS